MKFSRLAFPGFVCIVSDDREVVNGLQAHTFKVECGDTEQDVTIVSSLGTDDEDIEEILCAVRRFPGEGYVPMVLRAIRSFLEDDQPVPRYLWASTLSGPLVRH